MEAGIEVWVNLIGSMSLASALAYAVKTIWAKLNGKEAEAKTAAADALTREDKIRSDHANELIEVRKVYDQKLQDERDEQKVVMTELLDTLKGME